METLDWSVTKAQENNLDLFYALAYVAGVKDPGNYPPDFYQISDDVLAETMPERVRQTVPAIRGVRKYLNGQWAGNEDLIKTMRKHGEDNGWTGEEAEAIQLLFGLAGIALQSSS